MGSSIIEMCLPCIPGVGFRSRRSVDADDPIRERTEDWRYQLCEGGPAVEIFAVTSAADGMGKTRLLKQIRKEFDDADVRGDPFDVVLYATVSGVNSILRLQEDLLRLLGLPPTVGNLEGDPTRLQETYAAELSSALSNKNFLLLLDDAEEKLDLESVGIPSSPSRSTMNRKIVITTTSTHSWNLDDDYIVRVRPLSKGQSAELFWKNAGADALPGDDPRIRKLGETMIDRYSGLPLALIAAGRAMSTIQQRRLSERETENLENLITDSDQHPGQQSEMESVLYSALKLAYRYLRTDHLRECLLYCSLFPQGRSVSEELLVEHWIAHGLLEVAKDASLYIARNIGYEVLETLVAAGLLEKGLGDEAKGVKLHDAVRRMFHSLGLIETDGENKFVSPERESGNNDRWAWAQWVSLTQVAAAGLSEQRGKALSTLLLNPTTSDVPSSLVSGRVMEFTPKVRVLDLSGTSLEEVPPSIGRLSELLYLNLSFTKIKSLPTQLGKLTKLRHLMLTGTRYLLSIPLEAISSLRELQLLNLYMSAYYWNGSTINHLDQLERLDELGLNIKKDLSTLQSLYSSFRLYGCVRFLNVSEMEDLTANHLSKAFRILSGLTELSICSCQKMAAFDVEDGELLLLEVLKLEDLPLSTVVASPPSTGALVSLRRLDITYCNSLKDIAWAGRLPCLEELILGSCDGMEELVTEDGAHVEHYFPKLILMHLSHLKKLRSITSSRPGPLLPSLERIQVENCPQLRDFHLGPCAARRLKSIHGEPTWWDQLEWEDPSVKTILQARFVPRIHISASTPTTSSGIKTLHVLFLCALFIKNLQLSLRIKSSKSPSREKISISHSEDTVEATTITTTENQNSQEMSTMWREAYARWKVQTVWRRVQALKYAPNVTHEDIFTRALIPIRRSAPKEEPLELLRQSILIDDGKKSFWLEKATDKRCFLLSATNLWIDGGNDRHYWRSSQHERSRFSQVAEMIRASWVDIRGTLDIQDLSPQTTYTANLVYELSDESSGLEDPLQAWVAIGEWDSKRRVHLKAPPGRHDRPSKRDDKWMELRLGDFRVGEEGNETVHFGLKEVERLNWKGGLVIAGIEVRLNESVVGVRNFAPERSMERLILSARELNISWVNDQRNWTWRPDSDPRFSEVAELLSVCWFDVNGNVDTRTLSPGATYSAYLIFGFESNSYGFNDSLEASVASSVSAVEGADRRRVYLKPQENDSSSSLGQIQNDSFPSPRSDGWMQVELGDFYVDKGADDGETVSFRVQEVERLNWKAGLVIEGIEVTPKKMAPTGSTRAPYVAARTRARQEYKSSVVDTPRGQSYLVCPTDLSITWGSDSRYWRRRSHPHSRFSEVMELLSVCWLEINGKVEVRTLSPETNYAVYLVFNLTPGSYGLDTPQEAWVEFGEDYSSRSVRLEPADEFYANPPGEEERRSVVPSLRSDGWMELELGEFYHEQRPFGAQVFVKFGLKEVKAGNWKGGLIVEAVELRPKATPGDHEI